MDRATVSRVFEPFFTTKPKGHGTGLGLATVYGVVKKAGGNIDIYSEPGLGTSVSVLLPATDEDAMPSAGAAPRGDSQHGHGETILLVEDEESLRELTRRILTRHGYQVCVAAGGRDAVERAGDPAQSIDMLLTDVIMPEMLGNEVAAAVRAVRPGLPALYMSGYAQPILDSHGMETLSIDILEKPFTEVALLARVHETISRAPAQSLTGPGPVPGMRAPWPRAGCAIPSAHLTRDEGDGEVTFGTVTRGAARPDEDLPDRASGPPPLGAGPGLHGLQHWQRVRPRLCRAGQPHETLLVRRRETVSRAGAARGAACRAGWPRRWRRPPRAPGASAAARRVTRPGHPPDCAWRR